MNNIGTHQSHCCIRHGCKYGDQNCPVKLHRVVQDLLCEDCPTVKETTDNLDQVLNDILRQIDFYAEREGAEDEYFDLKDQSIQLIEFYLKKIKDS